MNDQATTDIADAIIEPPAIDNPTTVASVEDLMRWRADPSTKLGDSFTYYSGSSSLMVTRSRSVATGEITDSVMASYLSGRCVPVQRRNGQEWIYWVQAVDNAPVKPKMI
jgi:hypothetical protein